MSDKAKNLINKEFGGKVRVRVGGILIQNEKVLLLKHEGVGPDKYLWSPPGGGLQFGQDAKENLKREFLEETNLKVTVDDLLFTNEYIDERLHAIELFFGVRLVSGELKLGRDPEMGKEQILTEIAYFGVEDLKKEKKNRLHTMFHGINKPEEVLNLTGYFKFVVNSCK
ncbi:MAG: 8-oxo-dGTP diphosphatase [Marivirga sp.]|jgi:8-oxo-dGTP diphosphatase